MNEDALKAVLGRRFDLARVRQSPLELVECLLDEAADRKALDRDLKFQRRQALITAGPLIAHGEKFKKGGRGEGPVKKAIRKVLSKHPTLKPSHVWNMLKPPKGFTLCPGTAQLGRYIEGPAGYENMDYKRFQNACAEVRKSLKVPD